MEENKELLCVDCKAYMVQDRDCYKTIVDIITEKLYGEIKTCEHPSTLMDCMKKSIQDDVNLPHYHRINMTKATSLMMQIGIDIKINGKMTRTTCPLKEGK